MLTQLVSDCRESHYKLQYVLPIIIIMWGVDGVMYNIKMYFQLIGLSPHPRLDQGLPIQNQNSQRRLDAMRFTDSLLL
jgi:hypothetical protein